MKRITIVRTHNSIVNINTYNSQELGLARALSNLGYKISIIYAGKNYNYELLEQDINFYRLKALKCKSIFSLFFGLNKLLKEIRPDFVQIGGFNSLMAFQVVLLCKIKGIKTVSIQGVYEYNNIFFARMIEKVIYATFGRITLRLVNKIGYKTFMAKRFIEIYSRRKSIWTPIGLNVTKFSREKTKDYKKILNWQNKNILLYVGKFEKRRNIDFLIKLIDVLPENFRLLLVGNQKEVKISDKCYALGKLKQEELSNVYLSSDAFLLASSYEIYGMVIMEAMWHELPVFSSFTAGSEAIVKNGETGYILPNIEVNIWKEKILEYFNNIENQEMGKRAYNFIENNLIWKETVKKWLVLYKTFKQKEEK